MDHLTGDLDALEALRQPPTPTHPGERPLQTRAIPYGISIIRSRTPPSRQAWKWFRTVENGDDKRMAGTTGIQRPA